MRASSSVGKLRQNIVMLNDASHGEKWHQACGRVVFVRPSKHSSRGCKQCFGSAVPPAVQAPGVDPVEVDQCPQGRKRMRQSCGSNSRVRSDLLPPLVPLWKCDMTSHKHLQPKFPLPPSLKCEAERWRQGDWSRLHHAHQVGPGSIGSEGCPSAALPVWICCSERPPPRADSQYVGGLSLTGSRRPTDPSGQTGDLAWPSDSTYAPAELQHTYCAIIISYLAGASPSTAQI
ncbi:hypothetical protein Q8A73_011395 [Channa argus]|nr:hypothetical protein Q8A73_011395 [Channa argus]